MMVVYLNNAGQSELSPEVKAAGMAAVQRPPWEPHGSDDQGRIRELFASLIEAEATDIAIMPCTAFAITLAARNIQRTILQSRGTGKILLLQDQFNSAVYPWQQICEESKGSVSLEIVPHPTVGQEGGWTQAILDRLNGNVLATCLPPLHWSNGALIDLETIGVACRQHGVALIVDATQAVGIMPVSVKKIQPDFLACSVHKWLRAPPGTSICYVSERVRPSWIPLDLHGRSRDVPRGKDWDAGKNTMGPSGYPEKFFNDARKFDSGGKPNPTLLPMLRASLEQVCLIDREAAQAELKKLMDPLILWAQENGYVVPSEPRAYHLVGIEPPNRTIEEILNTASKLQEQGIIVAVRCGGFRISPYLNTTPSEIQTLLKGLEGLAKGASSSSSCTTN